MSLDSLKILEERIGEFINQHQRTREAQDELQKLLKDREKQLAETSSRLKRYEKERDEIRARLDRVLSRLEALEIT